MGKAVLEGTRVLDLGDFASGPYCARLLGDLGAEVIKVEPPWGDSARLYGPFPGDTPDRETSGLFLYLNYNKLGITLDYRSPSGAELLHSMLPETDVLILNSDLGGRVDFGIDIEDLHRRYPQLIIVAITPFGLTGKYAGYAGYDINASAMGGGVSQSDEPDREPIQAPALQMEMLTGLWSAFSTMVSIVNRRVSGAGRVIDVSQAQLLSIHAPGPVETPAAAAPGAPRTAKGNYPNQVLRCKDGFVYLYAPQIEQWLGFVAAMGEPEWTKERKFRDRRAMANDYPEETDALVEEWLMQHTKRELLEILSQHHVPSAPILNARDVVENDHLRERSFFQEIDHPVAGKFTYPGFQFRMSATPLTFSRPAPLLGQHNEEVFCGRLGLGTDDLGLLRTDGVI